MTSCRRVATTAVLGVALMLQTLLNLGCALLKPTPTPMKKIEYVTAERRPKTLLVLLPGRTSKPADYEKQGFVAAVRDRRIDVDMVSADAHMGYYYRWTFVPRLHEDVMLAGRRAGYEHIWLVGISAGGIGALNYVRYHPEMVSGIVAFAPFLGDKPILEAVRSAGGLTKWEPPATIKERDYQTATWAWLKGYVTSPASRPPLVIGIGSKDAFAPANRMVADVLPKDRVFLADGAHDWSAWKKMWADFLDAQTFWPKR